MGLAKQMGLIDNSMKANVPNSTKCDTYQDIQESHSNKGKPAVLQYEDVQGMLLVWLVGIVVAFAVSILEAVISLRTTYKLLDMVYFGAMESTVTEYVATESVETESMLMESALTDICQKGSLSEEDSIICHNGNLSEAESIICHNGNLSEEAEYVAPECEPTQFAQTHSVQVHDCNGTHSQSKTE